MKLKPAPLIAGLCLITLTSIPAFADTSAANTPTEDQLIQKLSQQTAALETEVGQLRSQIKHLQTKKAAVHHARSTATTATATSSSSAPSEYPILKKPYQAGHPQYAEVHILENKAVYVGGIPIMASPYLGVRSKFDGSDLISSMPVINEDLRLLTQEQKLRAVYTNLDLPIPDHSIIDLSGEIQGIALYQRPFAGAKTSDINVSDAELDTAVIFNRWVSGFMTVNFDNTPPAIGPRFVNSRFFMDRGFLTIGDLDCSPFYGSVGQLYVPFGQYTSSMISSPLTQSLGRTQERAVVVGYDQTTGTYDGLNVSMYAFRGDSRNPQANPVFIVGKINNGGINVDYSINNHKWNGDLDVGYIANIADSQNMQLVPGQLGSFTGFGGPLPPLGTSAESLVHRVPAVDVHGNVGVGNWNLIAEYILTTTNFSSANMTFNNHSAKPRAFHTELGYSLPFTQPTNINIGYDQTTDALALLLPQKRYIAALNTSFWRSTIESLEYRHDINYSASSRATGQNTIVVPLGLGHSSDTLSLQMTAYF